MNATEYVEIRKPGHTDEVILLVILYRDDGLRFEVIQLLCDQRLVVSHAFMSFLNYLTPDIPYQLLLKIV